MDLFKIFKGNSSNLPSEMHDGYCYFTMDDGIFYIDYLDTDGVTLKRKPISGPGKSIEYIPGEQTESTNIWLGTTKDEVLYTGKVIAYRLPYDDTSTAATLNLTLANNTQTGAIAVKRKGSLNVSSHYKAGEVIFLAYDGTFWQVNADYHSDTTTAGYSRFSYGKFAPTTELHRYQILLSHPTDSSKVIPLNTTSNSTETTKTTITTASFNPFEPIYYYSTTTTTNADTLINTSYLWNGYPQVDIRYSFNTGGTLTADKDVYLVAQMQSNGSAKLRNPGATDANASAQATGANAGPISQILPTSEDGYIYIKLGHATDTYRVTLTLDHPIYKYVDNKVQLWVPYAEKTKQTMALTNPNKLIQTVEENGNIVLKTIANSYVDNSGEHITIGENSEYDETLHVFGSVAEGDGSTATGYASHAEGSNTLAIGDKSHAEGVHSQLEGTIQLFCTDDTLNQYQVSNEPQNFNLSTKHKIYYNNVFYEIIEVLRNNNNLIIILKNPIDGFSQGMDDIVDIYRGGSFGENSHSENHETTADGVSSHAEGNATRAAGLSSHAEGSFTWAAGENAHTQGHNTKAFARRTHAEGNKTVAAAGNAHVEGVANEALGVNAHVEGNRNQAGWKSGQEDVPHGQASHAEGEQTKALADFSHTEGFRTKVGKDAKGAHAEGRYSYAAGIGAHAENNAAAIGNYSHAEGGGLSIPYGLTKAPEKQDLFYWVDLEDGGEAPDDYLNPNMTINCENTFGTIKDFYQDENNKWIIQLSGDLVGKSLYESPIYTLNTAVGEYSHAEGNFTMASGSASHAEGTQTRARGEYSHAEGIFSQAQGAGSHAEGENTTASGRYSHAEGCCTKANTQSQHVFGEYNVQDTQGTSTTRGQYVEIVGRGTSNSNRLNARTLDWNGNEWLAGKLTVNVNPTAAMDVVTKQYLENHTSDTKVIQTAKTDNVDYKLLTTAFAEPTSGAAAEAGYGANLAYNPSTNTLKTGNASLTGTLNVTGNTTFSEIPIAPTAAAGTHNRQLATTEFVTNSFATLNGAMVFKGTIGDISSPTNATRDSLPTPADGYLAGWTYRVVTSGSYAGQYCEVGDLIIAINPSSGSGTSIISTDWTIAQYNVDNAVYYGQNIITANTVPIWNNTLGEVKNSIISQSGSNINISDGLLKITNNNNTITIGSQNSNSCHFMNSANVPFYFNSQITVNRPAAIDVGTILTFLYNSSAYGSFRIQHAGTIEQDGEIDLILGNAIASGTEKNAHGKIRLYGTGQKYTTISSQANGNNKVFYLPQYASGDMYAVHAGSNSAVGSSTQPVYVEANGRVTAITGAIGNDITGNAATATKAIQDGNGNIITATYSPKIEMVQDTNDSEHWIMRYTS